MSEKSEEGPTRFPWVLLSSSRMRISRLGLSRETLADYWAQFVGALMILMMIAVSLYPATVISNAHPATFLLAGVMTLAFLAISVLVHEIGHAVAAWSVGWRVHIIVVGPFGFAPKRKRFLRISRRPDRQGFLGLVHATPPTDAGWNKGAISLQLGGAIGNLSLGLLSILIASAISELEIRLYAILVGLAATSTIFAIANLLPWRIRAGKSDGASLIATLRGEEPTARDREISTFFGMVYDGVPAEEWDVSALRRLADAPSNPHEHVDPLLIGYAFYMADLAAAKVILERYLRANPDIHFDYQCMYAFAIAMTDRDGLRASRILERLPLRTVGKSFSFWRAQAVTAHLLGRPADAIDAVQKARHIGITSGAAPDNDDEAVFQAIEQDQDLPSVRPRRRLLAGNTASSEARERQNTDI